MQNSVIQIKSSSFQPFSEHGTSTTSHSVNFIYLLVLYCNDEQRFVYSTALFPVLTMSVVVISCVVHFMMEKLLHSAIHTPQHPFRRFTSALDVMATRILWNTDSDHLCSVFPKYRLRIASILPKQMEDAWARSLAERVHRPRVRLFRPFRWQGTMMHCQVALYWWSVMHAFNRSYSLFDLWWSSDMNVFTSYFSGIARLACFSSLLTVTISY